MSKFNWDEHPIVDPKSQKAFNWDDHPVVEAPQEESGVLPTLVDKFAQGAAGGFADEASGAMEALGQVGGVQGLGGKIKDIQLSDHGPTLDWEVLKHAYIQARNKDRDVLKRESEDHPLISGAAELGGAVASPINKLIPAGVNGATAGAMIGAVQGAGNSESDNLTDLAKDTLIGTGVGAGAGALADKAAPAIGKLSNYVGSRLGGAAESLAENATGATAKQAEKFRPGSGRELLDRKLVQFGDNAENIAGRVSGAVDDANALIDNSLKNLDAKGVTASADNVVADLESQIAQMSKDPSKAGAVRKIKSIIEDIKATGESNVPISAAEETKRGFRKAAGNWMDPEAGQAGKQAYLSYMSEVENAAQAADPGLAKAFQEGKDTYGLLAPIKEATERRARQLNQSPIGGLGDLAAVGAGGAAGGPLGAIAGVVGKKVVAPRISSSAAVTLDKVSQSLLNSPQMLQLAQKNPAAFQELVHKLESHAVGAEGPLNNLFPKAADSDNGEAMTFEDQNNKSAFLQKAQGSKYAQVLQNAANKGDDSLNAAHYVLAQRDPEYRKLMEGGE
jgi:hypothetical protein